MKRLPLFGLLAALTLAGCASSGPSEGVSLKNDYTVTVIGGNGILRGSKLTLLKGKYVEHGEDVDGIYYQHKDRGVIRAGVVEMGGFYVPFDAKAGWRVWLVPYSGRDAMVGLYGPSAAAAPEGDSKGKMLILSNVPTDEMQGLKDDVVGLK
jgi:hypothetical protein